MPALPNVPGVLKVRMIYSIGGDVGADTIHHISYTGGPPSAANCVTMANSFLSAAGADFASLMSTDTSVTGCQVTDLSSGSGGQGVSTGASTVGTRAGAILAPGTSALVNYSIPRRYRGGKPRNYFPFGAGGDVTAVGLWLAAFITATNAGVTAWRTSCLGAGAGCALQNFVNVSYYSGFTAVENTMTGRWRNVPKVRAAAVVDILSAGVTAIHVGSQRRRNRKA